MYFAHLSINVNEWQRNENRAYNFYHFHFISRPISSKTLLFEDLEKKKPTFWECYNRAGILLVFPFRRKRFDFGIFSPSVYYFIDSVLFYSGEPKCCVSCDMWLPWAYKHNFQQFIPNKFSNWRRYRTKGYDHIISATAAKVSLRANWIKATRIW